ncbi:prevent-host-death protein [Frigoribacterium sp. PvP032]|uniref:prevent-host-death protein n=1 Tax=Frigoribacterium sp. PvP032 TaxID=2806589 RepID=UPI001AEA18F7|nr:prevent-host-death protein [Frigoribacterium sp. PvP032]MBP1191803.1 hypothetical protein [Frigoribacterium sp. PvP032]
MSVTSAPLVPSSHVVRSSDLSRHSAAVFAAAEDGPVEVTRRDGEALLLVTKREALVHRRVLEVAAQLIAVSLDDDGSLADRLSRQLPWIKLLSPADQEVCARTIIETARGAFVVNEPVRILTEITAWMNTAKAVAAGRGAVDDWLPDAPVVADPRG